MTEFLKMIIAVAALVVSVGVPIALYLMNAFRTDLIRLHSRIDDHISNYEIHKTNQGLATQ